MSDFKVLNPCILCGKRGHCSERLKDGAIHCRNTDRNSPPYGWEYDKDDATGARIFRPERDEGERRRTRYFSSAQVATLQAIEKEKRKAQRAAKIAGEDSPPAPASEKSSRFLSAEAQKRPMSDVERNHLAAELCLPMGSFHLLGVEFLPAGWDSEPWGKPAYLFPEKDGDEKIVSFLARYSKEDKKVIGKHRGVFFPAGWELMDGPIVDVEGPTDTIAGVIMNIRAVGSPANKGGVDIISEAMHRHGLQNTQVVVMGENDKKASGDWPGKEGAESRASRFKELGHPNVCIAYPPDGCKDIREFLMLFREPIQEGRMTIADIGKLLAEHIVNTVTIVADSPEASPPPIPDGLAGFSAAASPLPARLTQPVVREQPDWCPHCYRDIFRHHGRNQLGVFNLVCQKLTCPYCEVRKRKQYKATIRAHLGALEAQGHTEVYLYDVPKVEAKAVLASRKGERSYLRIDLGSGLCRIASLGLPASKRVQTVKAVPIQDAIARLCFTVDGMGLKLKGYTSSNDWNLIDNWNDTSKPKLINLKKIRRPAHRATTEKWEFSMIGGDASGTYRLQIDGKRTRPIAATENPVEALELVSGISFYLDKGVLQVTSDCERHKLQYLDSDRWERVERSRASDVMTVEILEQRHVPWGGFTKRGKFFDMKAIVICLSDLPANVTMSQLVNDLVHGEVMPEDFDPFPSSPGQQTMPPPGEVWVEFAESVPRVPT